MEAIYELNVGNQVKANLYRARRVGEPATLTAEQWQITLDYFYNRCAYCLRENACDYHIFLDHFIPLGMGGGTTWANCVPVCCGCNAAKRGYHPSEIPPHLMEKAILERVQNFLKFIAITP